MAQAIKAHDRDLVEQ